MPLVTRFNTAFRGATDSAEWGFQVGVAVPLKHPKENGLPGPEEGEELGVIEDLITAEAGDRAVLVGVISTHSMREFVLYAKAGDWIQGFHRDLRERVRGHEVQVIARSDPMWDVYKQFVE